MGGCSGYYSGVMGDWPRIVVHADMDAFYAAVEQLDNPELRGKPILVGPNSNRGVVLTASYEARPFRVGSAMPVAEARRRCPQAIMVPPRFERYEALSGEIMDIFGDFSPHVEAISLDEAFLDMSGAERLFGSPAAIGRQIKERVRKATGLNVSVGVASTKYVAKVASAHEKPDGLTVVPPAGAVRWLAPLPVSRLWGAGPKDRAPPASSLGSQPSAMSPTLMRSSSSSNSVPQVHTSTNWLTPAIRDASGDRALPRALDPTEPSTRTSARPRRSNATCGVRPSALPGACGRKATWPVASAFD